MAIPAYVEIHDDQGNKIEGDCRISRREGCIEIYAYKHMISIPVDSHSGQPTSTRQHEPFVFLKQFDRASPYLLKACCRGQTLKKVIIRWYRINDQGSEEEYFRFELENVKITAFSPGMSNVKDPITERYPHLESASLRYASIKSVHVAGGLEYTDSWNAGRG